MNVYRNSKPALIKENIFPKEVFVYDRLFLALARNFKPAAKRDLLLIKKFIYAELVRKYRGVPERKD